MCLFDIPSWIVRRNYWKNLRQMFWALMPFSTVVRSCHFGFTDEYIRALEIQIYHPDLDEDISDGIYGLKAYLSVAEDRFRDMESIQADKNYLDIKEPFNRIFSESEIIPKRSFAFNEDSVFSCGFCEESDLAHPSALVISLSQIAWFYRNQIIQSRDPETGEYRESIIAY